MSLREDVARAWRAVGAMDDLDDGRSTDWWETDRVLCCVETPERRQSNPSATAAGGCMALSRARSELTSRILASLIFPVHACTKRPSHRTPRRIRRNAAGEVGSGPIC